MSRDPVPAGMRLARVMLEFLHFECFVLLIFSHDGQFVFEGDDPRLTQ
jgi:hypothetical protein